jgi:hypothetical protein
VKPELVFEPVPGQFVGCGGGEPIIGVPLEGDATGVRVDVGAFEDVETRLTGSRPGHVRPPRSTRTSGGPPRRRGEDRSHDARAIGPRLGHGSLCRPRQGRSRCRAATPQKRAARDPPPLRLQGAAPSPLQPSRAASAAEGPKLGAARRPAKPVWTDESPVGWYGHQLPHRHICPVTGSGMSVGRSRLSGHRANWSNRGSLRS